jgi:hypothetical protein
MTTTEAQSGAHPASGYHSRPQAAQDGALPHQDASLRPAQQLIATKEHDIRASANPCLDRRFFG